MILLPETSISDALNVIDRVRVKVADYKIQADEDLISLTASFGIASLDKNCLTTDELIKNADNALYQAKKIGKNCIAVWDVADSNQDHKEN